MAQRTMSKAEWAVLIVFSAVIGWVAGGIDSLWMSWAVCAVMTGPMMVTIVLMRRHRRSHRETTGSA